MKFFKCTLSLTLAVLIFISMTSVMIVGAKDVELADVGAWNTSYTSKLNGDPANDIAEIAYAQNGKGPGELGITGSWCARFVSECAAKISQNSAIPYNAGVAGMYNAVLNAGGYKVSTPQKGDLVFYYCTVNNGWCHVAIMYDNNISVHGNYSNKVKVVDYTNFNDSANPWPGPKCWTATFIRPAYTNAEHTCNQEIYYSYWKDHPHYYIYKCSVCGKENTNYDKTGYLIDCSECRVGKTVVRSNKQVYDYGESVFLSWDKVPNATHYSFYIMKKDDSGEYKEQIDLIREYESTKYARNDLDVGEYMIEMYSYDRNHWEKGNTDWCHERAEDIFFEVTDTRPSPVASMEYNGNTYRVYDYYTSWSNAKQMCEDLGGNLVTITSQEEMNEIKNLLVDAELYGYWIGFNDVDKDGIWENVTGEDTGYNYWGENQPDCYENNEYCAVIQNENDLKWNDVPDDCESYPIGFICEIENTEPDHTHEYTQYSESSSPCSSEYTRLYTCWICGETYEETGYKTAEHKYEIIENIASTCSTEGKIAYKCNLCGDSYTKTIEPNGDHIPSDEWTVLKMPNETSYGIACKLCTLCNTQIEYATIDINGNIVSSDDNPSAKPQPPVHDQPLEYDIDAYIADEHTGDVMFNWSAHSGAAYYNIRIFDNDLKEIVNENVEEPYYHWSPITAEKGMLSVASYDANGIMFAESSLVTYNICLVAMGDWWGEYGDVDCSGKVNIKDATLIQKYLSKLADIADVGLGAADVNSDEKINIKDATAIQKYLASISTDTKVGEFYHYAFTDYEITLET